MHWIGSWVQKPFCNLVVKVKMSVLPAGNQTTAFQSVACLLATTQNKQRNSKYFDSPQLLCCQQVCQLFHSDRMRCLTVFLIHADSKLSHLSHVNTGLPCILISWQIRLAVMIVALYTARLLWLYIMNHSYEYPLSDMKYLFSYLSFIYVTLIQYVPVKDLHSRSPGSVLSPNSIFLSLFFWNVDLYYVTYAMFLR
jgi:hypothetical protein